MKPIRRIQGVINKRLVPVGTTQIAIDPLSLLAEFSALGHSPNFQCSNHPVSHVRMYIENHIDVLGLGKRVCKLSIN